MISHGSHSHSDNKYTSHANKFLANGLLFSDFSNNVYCQSPFALKVADKLTSGKQIRKIPPLMWGHNYLSQDQRNLRETESKIFKIIYAGTFKPYCLRPSIYETSFEMIKSLDYLIRIVSKVKDTQLTVRIRDEDECTVETLRDLLPNSNNWVLNNSGPFDEQLLEHDFLISYSSTTLEEALSYSIPVGTFTSDSNYKHLKQVDSGSIFNLDRENLEEQLKSIKKLIKNRSFSKSKEVNKAIWMEGEADNFMDFLS